MLPCEFTITGTPISHQTHNIERLRLWQASVRNAATKKWPSDIPPTTVPLKITVVYYHDRTTARIDNDNLIKPIQDALNGLIYVDDVQMTDTQIRKTDINGSFHVRYISKVLANAFSDGAEFVYVKIEAAPDHKELLT